MDSILKKQRSKKIVLEDDFLDSFLKKIHLINSRAELELLAKKIRYLGLHFNPFAQDHELECLVIIDQLDLKDQLHNPYHLTNIILRLLDLIEEKLNNLMQ